jgi:hypothetical protein
MIKVGIVVIATSYGYKSQTFGRGTEFLLKIVFISKERIVPTGYDLKVLLKKSFKIGRKRYF